VGELLDALRPLLDRTDQPYAAIGLEVSPAGDRASLRHLGEAVVRVDAGPGWMQELPFDHGFEAGSGSLRLTVGVVVYEREHPVEATLVAASGPA
jgi:hypothetical protein